MELDFSKPFREGLNAGRDQIRSLDNDQKLADETLKAIGTALKNDKQGLKEDAYVRHAGNTITITRSADLSRIITVNTIGDSLILVTNMNDDNDEVQIAKVNLNKQDDVEKLVRQLGIEVINLNENGTSKV